MISSFSAHPNGYDLTTATGFESEIDGFNEIVTKVNAAVEEFNQIITTNIRTEDLVIVDDDSENIIYTESEEEVVVLDKKTTTSIKHKNGEGDAC